MNLKAMHNGIMITKAAWEWDDYGLTFEDYQIHQYIVGFGRYYRYHIAHRRDSDIMDKSDVWKKLREEEI